MGDSQLAFLKFIDQRISFSFTTAVYMWQERNNGFYQQLQQYSEHLLKSAVDKLKKTTYLENKSSLGIMLNNSVVISILRYDLYFEQDQIDDLRRLNSLANQVKHTLNTIELSENDALHFFKVCYEFTSAYLKNLEDIEIDRFNDKNLLRMINGEFEREIQTSNLIKRNVLEVQQENAVIYLENQEYYIQKEDQDQFNTNESSKKNIQNLSNLKLKFSQINTTLEQSEKEYKENKSILLKSKIEEITYELEAIKEEIKNLSDKIRSSDVILTQKEAISKTAQSEINRIKNRRISVHTDIGLSKSEYEISSKLLRHLRVSYDNGFLGTENFSITNLFDEDKCVSKYASLYAVTYNQLIRGKNLTPSNFLVSLNLIEDDLEIIYKIEIAILLLIRNGLLMDDVWNIHLVNKSIDYLEIAIQDIFNRLNKLSILSNIEITKPIVNISSIGIAKDALNIVFDVNYVTRTDVFTINNDYSETNLSHLWIEKKIDYKVVPSEIQLTHLRTLVFEFFNFKDFRFGQLEILTNVLNNKSTIGILTTSGGKSLIYQFAALMQPKLTIIVDPINALINDQYRKLTQEFNVTRALKLIDQKRDNKYISTKTAIEELFNRPAIYNFLTPERFQSEIFREWFIAQSIHDRIGLIVLDEVHCLSEWGHDFRVAYLMLTTTINTYCTNIQYLGLTATAAINVIKDLQVELGIYDKQDIVFTKKLQRDNLNFHIAQFSDYSEMSKALQDVLEEDYKNEEQSFKLRDKDSNAIIVFFKIKSVLIEMKERFEKNYRDEIALFHGNDKSSQDDFIENRKTLLFATKAFGMGIDKPNVRKTIHFGIPASREAYFQEAGRAGRDGKKSQCLLFTFDTNQRMKNYNNKFLDLATDTSELLKIQESIGFASTNDLSTIAYFMTQDLEMPIVEAENALNVLNEIRLNQSSLTYAFNVDKNKIQGVNSSGKLENNLYILHKIGIVRTWTIEYINLEKPIIKVSLNPDFEDLDHIKESAMNYVNQYVPNNNISNKIVSINSYNQLKELIIIVREWYQNTFIRSKREQLANMYEFVSRYKNQIKNEDIQNEMSQFFDISRLLERRDSKLSLTFDNVQLSEVIRRSAILKEKELQLTRITMERLLETEESNRINLFTSLLNLRANNFNSRNGAERLNLAFKQCTVPEIEEIFDNIKPIYEKCTNENKLELAEQLYSYDNELFREKVVGKISDDVISKLVIYDINQKYNSIF